MSFSGQPATLGRVLAMFNEAMTKRHREVRARRVNDTATAKKMKAESLEVANGGVDMLRAVAASEASGVDSPRGKWMAQKGEDFMAQWKAMGNPDPTARKPHHSPLEADTTGCPGTPVWSRNPNDPNGAWLPENYVREREFLQTREFQTVRYTPVSSPGPLEFAYPNGRPDEGASAPGFTWERVPAAGGASAPGAAANMRSNRSNPEYTLRCAAPSLPASQRVKYLIVITMYNEDATELKGTLLAVARNIHEMQRRAAKKGRAGAEMLWRQFAVVIVSDGRTKANDKTLQWAQDQGIFHRDMMDVTRQLAIDRDVFTVHLFEGNLQLEMPYDRTPAEPIQDSDGNVTNEDYIRNSTHYPYYQSSQELMGDSTSAIGRRFPPVQTLFALKEHNAQKLDSHYWFFYGFAEKLLPRESETEKNDFYTLLLDVGTMPSHDAICRLIRSFKRNHQIAGVCGEIAVHRPRLGSLVEASQNFEYKISNIMDKALESCCGFISVLPGAFSAYRYVSIRNAPIRTAMAAGDILFGKGPLREYFKLKEKDAASPFIGNMYLAEDRILCFELISRENCNWTMHYVKDAVATTDVPGTLVALIKQRRRWLNGSFFAMLYAISHMPQIWTASAHSFSRKVVISAQFFYFFVNVILNWVLAANLYLTMYYVLSLSFPNSLLFNGLSHVYVFLIICQFVVGIGNAPNEREGHEPRTTTEKFYHYSMLGFGFIMFSVFLLSLYQFYFIVVGGLPPNGLLDFGTARFECDTTAMNKATEPIPGGLAFTIDTEVFNHACGDVNYYRDGGIMKAPTCARLTATQVMGLAFFSLGSFFVAALLHGEFFAICGSFLQYFFMLPSYVNILMIYSFCNTHDLSWGTKGLEAPSAHNVAAAQSKQEDESLDDKIAREKKEVDDKARKVKEGKVKEERFKIYRSLMMMGWILCNALLVTVCMMYVSGECYLTYLAYVVAGFNSVRIVGCILYMILRMPCLGYRGRGCNGSEASISSIQNQQGYVAMGGQQPYQPPAAGGAAPHNPATASGAGQRGPNFARAWAAAGGAAEA